MVCSLKLCEQISTSNQGLLLFECGKSANSIFIFLGLFSRSFCWFPKRLSQSKSQQLHVQFTEMIGKAIKKKTTTTEMSEINQSIVVRHVSLSFSLIPRAARLSPLAERIGRFWGRERVNWTFDERTF